MATIINPASFDQFGRFGRMALPENEDQQYNQNGVVQEDFTATKPGEWMSNWSLTTAQVLANVGNDITDTYIFAVHHKAPAFWHGVTHLQIAGQTYKITTVSPDKGDTPTSVDLVTVKAVNADE